MRRLSLARMAFLYSDSEDGGGGETIPQATGQNTNTCSGKCSCRRGCRSLSRLNYAIPPGNPLVTSGGRAGDNLDLWLEKFVAVSPLLRNRRFVDRRRGPGQGFEGN